MTLTPQLEYQVDAFLGGRGFAVLTGLRLLSVSGTDARRWLGDLITADVAGMIAGDARRSLVLTPTGRIRADLLVLATDDGGFVLAQEAEQDGSAEDILTPYVLSSAVELRDVSDERTIVFVGPSRYLQVHRVELDAVERQLDDEGLTRVRPDALEVVRVRRGEPRLGVDVLLGALPVGARLEGAIDATKGCFLGQEAVAKVRNLGHPPTALVHLGTAGGLVAGMPIHTPGGAVGNVTSAVPAPRGGTIALARVDWEAAGTALSAADGTPLEPIED
jgi:folate-binding protein YgfZ